MEPSLISPSRPIGGSRTARAPERPAASASGAARRTRVPGIATVLDLVGFDALVQSADVVVTGEGSFDYQSLSGKVVNGVAEAATRAARPTVVLAGRVEVGRREMAAVGVESAYSVVDLAGSVEAALDRPASDLPSWPRAWLAPGRAAETRGRVLGLRGATCHYGWECSAGVTRLTVQNPMSVGPNVRTTHRSSSMTVSGSTGNHDQPDVDSGAERDHPHRRSSRQGQEPARAGRPRRPVAAGRGPAGRLLRPALPALLRRALARRRRRQGLQRRLRRHRPDERPYLGGATIDFVDTIEKQGFTIDNPNASGSCACGDSFH